ncbi:hypothetical protein XENTR_v10013336 [Xenopus tropicalis]|nr:hypothetical protein XENTR_v10013336 [Xenopus tropicalis]
MKLMTNATRKYIIHSENLDSIHKLSVMDQIKNIGRDIFLIIKLCKGTANMQVKVLVFVLGGLNSIYY